MDNSDSQHQPHKTVKYATADEHREVANKVNSLEINVTRLTQNVETLAGTVNQSHQDARANFEKLFTKVGDVGSRIDSRGKITPSVAISIVSTVLLILGSLAAFIVLHTAPIKELAVSNRTTIDKHIDVHSDDRYSAGIRDGQIQMLREELLQLREENRFHRARPHEDPIK